MYYYVLIKVMANQLKHKTIFKSIIPFNDSMPTISPKRFAIDKTKPYG